VDFLFRYARVSWPSGYVEHYVLKERGTDPVNKYYLTYIVLGILYVVVKIAFVSFGYLHVGAIAHGSIPATLTVLACSFAIKEKRNISGKIYWHFSMSIVPLLTLVGTPIYMYIKAGDAWLAHGRLPVLIIYVTIAVIQAAIAFIVISKAKICQASTSK
jgi:hypothetical protein